MGGYNGNAHIHFLFGMALFLVVYFVCVLFIYLKASIRIQMMTGSLVMGREVRLRMGGFKGLLFRVRVPTASIESLRLCISPDEDKPYLLTRFSNGESIILSKEVHETIGGDLVPGNDVFERRYVGGGRELDHPVIETRRSGILIYIGLLILTMLLGSLVPLYNTIT